MDTSNLFRLMRLPCDCVCDMSAIVLTDECCACPWCAAEFSRADFTDWYYESDALIMLTQSIPLIDFDGVILQVIGRCDCGQPRVREEVGGEINHFSAMNGDYRWLRN